MEDQLAPRRLYPALVATAAAILLSLGALGIDDHADIAWIVILALLLFAQLRTGYTFDRLAGPGAKRSKEPVGYWVGVGLTVIAFLAVVAWALGRRNLLPLAA